MIKRIFALVLALLLMCSITVFASAESAVNEARQGVVKILQLIYVDGQLDANLSSMGTGFFVGEKGSPVKYLVTNYHVVSDYLYFGEGETVKTQNQYGTPVYVQVQLLACFDSEDSVEAYVLDYDETQDIAVLKLENATDKRTALPLRVPTDSMVGDSMYVVGYPGSNEKLDTTSAWGVEDSIIAKGTLGRLLTQSGTGDMWIGSTDIDIHRGNSGGPVLDENGAVIGVACWGSATFDGVYEEINYAVNIEAVKEMLSRNSVPYEMADDMVEPTATPVPTAAPAPTAAPDPTPAPTPAPEPAPDYTLVIIAAVAAVVIAAVVIVVVVSKGKKKKQPVVPEVIQRTAPAPTTTPVKRFSPVVRSLAPQHNRKKVAIKSNPVIIGRSKECDIIFKDGTPGVSGRHCAVTWDDAHNAFVLKDMNSTYGTFLDSGMKLDPNRVYRLKAGDKFYLGDKENTLCVELD